MKRGDEQIRKILRPIMRHKRPSKRVEQSFIWLWAVLLALGIIAIKGCDPVFADSIPDDLAVRCIIGEASNQGEQGMYALASGLLNRGTTRGVYGCHASHVDKEPAWVFVKARVALQKAKAHRLHIGTHWENINAFGVPKWAQGMKEVYRYRDHVFYAKGG